jgi:hypothetical protein
MRKDRSATIDASSWATITPGSGVPTPSAATTPRASYPPAPIDAALVYGSPVGRYVPPPKPANRGWIIAVGAVVGVIVTLIAVAVAIPVFLNQRKPEAVTLTLPTSMAGGTLSTTPQAQQVTSTFVTGFGNDERGLLTDVQAGVYTRSGSTGFVVGTAKLVHRPTAAQRNAFMAEFAKGAAATASLTMTKFPPGPLGGVTECGMLQTATTPAVVCISMDNAAVVVTIDYTSDLLQGTTDALQLRGDVEHK